MKSVNSDVKISNFSLLCALFLFAILMIRLSQLSLSTKVDGINLQEFASKRTTKKTVIKASRGTIYDVNGNALAQDVSSYTLIAYLDPKRTTNENKPQHVVDKKNTALVLSAILDMDYDTILSYLSKEGVYQTEFGVKGKGLNEIIKDRIKEANLPGIDFVETTKRYYPYGDFASYLVGYAKALEDGSLTGELGIEKTYNDVLTGKNGSVIYQKDRNGYKIVGTKELREEAKDGSSIYLTIDNNVQFFVEQAIDKYSDYKYESLDIVVAEAKTGRILASATNPSFDPNLRNLTNYMDEITSVAFEPGSTMKIFTYMAALEAGVYKGDELYKSGGYTTKDNTLISDWNKVGWGYISYDKGFIYSSNTAVVNLMNKYLNPLYFKNYLLKLGFGSKTGIGGNLESSGKINFKYETEILNASFGQGITTTPIQYIKALTSIANDGTLLSPYIIDKIVDANGKVTFEGSKNELGRVASSETVEYIKNLMYRTINDPDGIGKNYKIEGYDIIGKTGTAQIASTNGKGYLTGNSNLNRSVALMFPRDNPEIIIYGVVKKGDSVQALSNVVKTIVKDISKYYNIYDEVDSDKSDEYEINNYINQDVKDTTKTLTNNGISPIILGDGARVINQYPKTGIVHGESHVFLLTDGKKFTMPDLTGYSKSDVMTFCNLLNLECVINGNGYVTSQSIAKNSDVNGATNLEVNLNLLYTKKN